MLRPVLIRLLLGCALVTGSSAQAQVREMRGATATAGRTASGWVGITFRSSPAPAEDVVVEDVVDGAPAARAGVLVGDRIVQWNGRTDVAAAIRGTNLQPGDSVRIRIRRPGARDRDMAMVAQPRPLMIGFGDPQEIRNALAELSSQLRLNSDSLRLRADSLRLWSPVMPGMNVEEVRRMFTFPPPYIALDSLLTGFQNGWPGGIGPDGSIDRFRSIMEGNQLGSTWPPSNGGPSFPPEMAEWTAEGLIRDFGPGFGVTITGARNAVAGAELTDVGAGLASYFGTDRGVLVLRIIPGTPSARAGLQEGDVIVSAGGRSVGTVSDLRRSLGESANRPVQVEVIRHRERRTLTLGG